MSSAAKLCLELIIRGKHPQIALTGDALELAKYVYTGANAPLLRELANRIVQKRAAAYVRIGPGGEGDIYGPVPFEMGFVSSIDTCLAEGRSMDDDIVRLCVCGLAFPAPDSAVGPATPARYDQQ